ncbi:hypothetical protein BpHYR1_034147 [Brachionus plicatilis]|uniref:Uncharacterized protein n=1 Tax=Brachionus plicatilis TaxID=10195 RepID=A0A3M7S6S4_BRAPC|nr:hypothetical protein BpHYR1_034147 [Brachionus plicatilis]
MIIFMAGFPLVTISFLSLLIGNLKEKIKFSSDLLTLPEDLSCDMDFRFDNMVLILIKYRFINFFTSFSISSSLLATYLMILDRYLFITNQKYCRIYFILKNSYSIMLPIIILIAVFLNFDLIGLIIFEPNITDWFDSLKLKLNISQDIFQFLFVMELQENQENPKNSSIGIYF